ncbi:ABC-type branched-chain amino acid transport system, ATPase component [Halanaeroarchaeum sp. HSR-CO]|uniref:ABC transporter ATP-binding protein n=1 Tax=Halanaeroarchaeum sp. HSR-CO TaxID=2866382 RepID=UPI00217DF4EB|nr:ABC transporter ATP-binding protein [Halanaeroarchaeum sp. HSR-CO]UWG47087.1 ABC-type branched-chain amino acid transport system, ATPase component [Halanaeroarchaeum sp. HSR-CO]
MNENNPILEVDEIEVFYGETQALFGVSLDVYEGELVTMIGGNGAGKTTTLRTISGLINPRTGTITFEDTVISDKAPDEIVKLGIAQSPEGRMLFPELTVKENLRAGAYHRSDEDEIQEDLEEVYEYFPQLPDLLDHKANDLSGGQQQMLTIGRALMSDPDLLLLDEPSLGLAPQLVTTIGGIVEDLRDAGQTILLVEQNAELALDISDRGYVIQTGEVVASGPTEELRETDVVESAYLGH